MTLLLGVNCCETRGLRDLEFAEREVAKLGAVLRQAGFEAEVLTAEETGGRWATLLDIQAALGRVL